MEILEKKKVWVGGLYFLSVKTDFDGNIADRRGILLLRVPISNLS